MSERLEWGGGGGGEMMVGSLVNRPQLITFYYYGFYEQ